MTRTRTIGNEGDVKKEVKKLLDRHQWFWFMPPANGFGRGGISDFIAIRNGVFLAIETKFGSNEPSAMQQGFLGSIRANEGFAFVVSNKNLGSFAAWLEAFDRSTDAASREEIPAPEDGAMMLNAMREMM